MCGICGSLALDGSPVDPAPVRAMLGALVHRGPDAEGLLSAPGVVAGIRRLAVIDVAGGGQPQASEDGRIEVVFNGEIYNFRELRTQLEARGHRFATRSDTEVLVHLWEDDGPRMVDRLNGMFAFCLHDRRSRETFIARDPLGVKPLYWIEQAGRVTFASEVAALVRRGGVAAELDAEALIDLFTLQYVPGDRTLYRGVRKLLPGHALHVREGRVRVERYYETPSPDSTVTRGDGEELYDLVRDAVRLQRVSDVPLGVFLSGGLDSSAIATLLAAEGGAPTCTFSVGFAGEPGHDERAHARLVAEGLGASHRELVLDADDVGAELPRLVAHLGEPVTDPAMIPTALLSRFARRHVTVVLTGEGADELFAGYRRYAYQARLGWLARWPGLLPALRALGPDGRAGQALEALAGREPAERHLRWSATAGSTLLGQLFATRRLDRSRERLLEQFRPHFAGSGSALSRTLLADQREWLPHNLLAKVDRATMAASLEARVPFLDPRLVAWANALPDRRRIDGGVGKVALRDAFAGRLPPTILARPKRGFDLPLDAWLRGPLQPLVTERMTRAALERWDGLEVDAALGLAQRHRAGEPGLALPLFILVSIALFLDGPEAET